MYENSLIGCIKRTKLYVDSICNQAVNVFSKGLSRHRDIPKLFIHANT